MKAGAPTRAWHLLGIVLILALWALGSLLFGEYIIPSPASVGRYTLETLARWQAWRQILLTLLRVLAGFGLGLSGGVLIGLLSGSRPELEAVFRPGILLFQGVPPILWSIPLILILGVGPLSPVLVIALICLPLVALNIAEGIKSVPADLAEMLQVFAPGLYARLRELIVPHLAPFLAAAMNLGLVLGIKASAVAEFFGARDGIGFQIQSAYQALQVRRLFTWGLVLVLLVALADRLLGRLNRVWRQKRTRSPRLPASSREIPPGERERLLARRAAGRLRLEGVSYSYTGRRPVLEGIDLNVEPQQVAVISGESGVGKTTLLRVAVGLLRPAAGRVEAPRRIGMVFQDDRFLPWRSILWNAALPLVYQGVERRLATAFAADLLEEVGLGGEEAKLPDQLSGGMRKRLAFARCFACLPQAVVLDEPFTGLHREARERLWRKFFNLLIQHPVPVVVVTHFPEEVPCPERCDFYTLSGRPARLMPAGW